MIKLKNNTIGGVCSNCGECCSDFLHLSVDEIERIDNYLKEHKVIQFNKGENNFRCPFRDDFLHRCQIYKVRPYICQIFKCDTPPEQVEFNRNELNKGKTPRSMALLFFNDDSKQKFLKDKFGMNVCGRSKE